MTDNSNMILTLVCTLCGEEKERSLGVKKWRVKWVRPATSLVLENVGMSFKHVRKQKNI